MNGLINVSNCKNCQQQIEDHNFCPNCGSKKITKRITFKNLITEFADRFFNLDNSFTRTFVHLFTKPEEVIDGYINGLRKRYINAFGYFALSVTITGIYGFIVKDRIVELTSTTMSSLLSKQELEAHINDIDVAFQYNAILSFILIPILALLSRLVFLNYKKYNLTEHLVIYLYSYSHIVAVTALIQIPIIFLVDNYFIMAFAPFVVYFFYIGYVLKKLYSMSIKRILLKTLLFLILFLGSFVLLSISFAILANFVGDPETIGSL